MTRRPYLASQASMVDASLIADDGFISHHGVYRVRSEVKRAPMRPAGVRKMRHSRKRRKPAVR